MDTLNTQTVMTQFSTVYQSQQVVGGFKIEIPQSTVMVSKPLSYEFRVAEFVNKKDEVIKVGLQVCVFEHDNYGVRQLRQSWTDVERVKGPL